MLSGLDVLIVLLAVAGILVGMKIGVVSAFFDILGGFLGSWAAARFYPTLLKHIPDPSKAYFLIFAVTAGVCVGAGIFLSQKLERHFLGLIDKFLGALLGIVLSLTLVTALLFPMLLSQSPAALAMLHRAAFAPYVMRRCQKHFRVTPPELWNRLDPLLEPPSVYRIRQLVEKL